MKRETAGSIEDYLAALPADRRHALEALRGAILEEAPGAEECFSYGMPAFRFEKRVLVAYAARSGHLALYPMSGGIVAAFEADLAGFDTSKGTIHFQPDNPLPDGLVRRIVKARIEENRRG
ncbi:MAG TPA: DUF1801 domain-containing protein [Candidatus Fermentibacter daniensis]|nr:DUF1801 domain-containing protein [Candidatus Fermentibacter daniensis]HPH40655.1 DUF1801 domain-containing protein [Candidatus Fermentibacter daniensis]